MQYQIAKPKSNITKTNKSTKQNMNNSRLNFSADRQQWFRLQEHDLYMKSEKTFQRLCAKRTQWV